MYAVIETGGKQYRVEVGTELAVELLDAEPGASITIDRVLLVGDGDDTAVGRPVVADATVEAQVVRRDRGDKIIVFKYRPKARRRVKKGHRQDHTHLRITDVRLGDRSAAESLRRDEQVRATERQRLEEAAARQAAADAELAARLAQQAESARSTETPEGAGKRRTRRTRSSAAPEAGGAAPAADATAPEGEPAELEDELAAGDATAAPETPETPEAPQPTTSALADATEPPTAAPSADETGDATAAQASPAETSESPPTEKDR